MLSFVVRACLDGVSLQSLTDFQLITRRNQTNNQRSISYSKMFCLAITKQKRYQYICSNYKEHLSLILSTEESIRHSTKAKWILDIHCEEPLNVDCKDIGSLILQADQAHTEFISSSRLNSEP